MTATRISRHHRGFVRFHSDDTHRFSGIVHCVGNAHQGAAGADAGDKGVNLAAHLPKNFRSGCDPMAVAVIRIGELARQEDIFSTGGKGFEVPDRRLHIIDFIQ